MKDQYDERGKIINNHIAVIQSRDETIRSLEADLADMFQKMVQCDKQVRSEMQEKFNEEKCELDSKWYITKHLFF